MTVHSWGSLNILGPLAHLIVWKKLSIRTIEKQAKLGFSPSCPSPSPRSSAVGGCHGWSVPEIRDVFLDSNLLPPPCNFALCPGNSGCGSDLGFPAKVTNQPLKTAVFALGSFWRSEAVFGCLKGVVRTTVGYSGGTRSNPDYRRLGDHAESVQIEYDPRVITYRQLLDVFWSSHDSRQVFGQGPDVGNQYRSIIFTNGTGELRLATISKEREQIRSKNTIVTTQIQQLEIFYPAESEHQKFEIKRNPIFLHLIGNLPAEELERSNLAAKLNSYAAELCPPRMQKHIDAKINEIMKRGWPVLREI